MKRAVRWLMVIGLLAQSLWQVAVAQTFLQDAQFTALPGGKVELRFDFDAPPPMPRSYKIDQPARLVLDLWGVTSDLPSKQLDVATSSVKQVNFAQTDGRLRMVVNLTKSSAFTSHVENNSLYVLIDQPLAAIEAPRTTVEEFVSSPKLSLNAQPLDQTRVQGIDFKRASDGVGRVVISLSDAQAGVDIAEEGNNVVVNLVGASLSKAFEQTLDVQDFGTPVLFVDAMSVGENTQILVKPSAEPFTYLAYQTGSQLLLDFKPMTLQEEQERQAELFPFKGDPLDLNFQDIDLRSVLQIIAEVAELNLVVSDDVTGNITLRLKNVPWDQALDIVLKTKNLDKRILGNVLLVANAEEIRKREAAELENTTNIEKLSALQTEFIQVDFRKASEMMAHLQQAKLVSERGFIMADDETNILMVRETQTGIEEIRKTLRKFDVEVEQVMIEARLVTARSSVSKELGVKWGFGANDGNAYVGSSLGGLETISTSGFSNSSSDGAGYGFDTLAVDLGITSSSSFAVGIANGSSALLGLELAALESDGQAEIISQPKIVTTNGKTASIQSGREIPYQVVEDGEVSVEFKDVVLLLDVTPRINPGERIAMDLKIKQDSIGETLSDGSISIDNNELETSVVVPDGQTIVLGGVFQETSTEAVAKTPLLGDLPVLGNLFRSKQNTGAKTELLIFITPKLIRESVTVN